MQHFGIYLSIIMFSRTSLTLSAQTSEEVKKRAQLKCGVACRKAYPDFLVPISQEVGMESMSIYAERLLQCIRRCFQSKMYGAFCSGAIYCLAIWRDRYALATRLGQLCVIIDFIGVTYYDDQGFMVPKNLGLKSLKELNGATVCVNLGTKTELNLADYFHSQKMTYKLESFEKMMK
jgi:hypothetical protein